MKRLAKIIISAGVFGAMAASGAVARWFGRNRPPHLVVLFYHAVPDAAAPNFARQMQLLARWARVVPADWDGDTATGDHPRRRFVVSITFDDAFESALENALPILARHKFPCTIFVPSGCLGAPPNWQMEPGVDSGERVADAHWLSGLPDDLITIGSHTVTHPRLNTLPAPAVMDELERSMHDLTGLIGRDVKLLAFPYGGYNDAVIEMCRSSGYRQVFTVEPRRVNPASGAFARGRVAVDAADGTLEFFLKMSGAYGWMPFASAIKRRFS